MRPWLVPLLTIGLVFSVVAQEEKSPTIEAEGAPEEEAIVTEEETAAEGKTTPEAEEEKKGDNAEGEPDDKKDGEDSGAAYFYPAFVYISTAFFALTFSL